MKRLVNRRASIPNGFLYEQRETGWRSWLVDPSTQWDFFLLCRSVQAHRQSNPQFKLNTNLAAIENEIEAVNVARIAAMPGTESYLMEVGSAQESFLPAPTLASQAAAAVGAIKVGKDVIFDWEESGQPPVAQELANKRADTCAVCPKNGRGGLSRYFTVPVAALIQTRLEKLHQVKMVTPADNQIGVCEACLCPLRLKVWTPMEFLLKHTTPQQWDAFQKAEPRCWMHTESEAIPEAA